MGGRGRNGRRFPQDGRHARADVGVGVGQAAAQWHDEEALVRLAQTLVDVRFAAAVHQGQEDPRTEPSRSTRSSAS